MEIPDIAKKKFVITAELGPPKGTDMTGFFKQAGHLKGIVDACNVTDSQAAIMKMGPVACCHLLKDFGIEPILQITCRDRNRIAIQSELLAAAALGIRNVLVLTGDPIHIGDHPEAKPVFDIDAADLIALIHRMEKGQDHSGNRLDGAPEFAVAAALNPCVNDLDTELAKTARKIEKGAEFFQTQGIFDPALFDRFIRLYREKGFHAPILAGIILLKSSKMARFMNEKIPGIRIPQTLIGRLDKASNPRKESVRIASETIRALRPSVQGVHLMALGWEELLPEVIRESGIA